MRSRFNRCLLKRADSDSNQSLQSRAPTAHTFNLTWFQIASRESLTQRVTYFFNLVCKDLNGVRSIDKTSAFFFPHKFYQISADSSFDLPWAKLDFDVYCCCTQCVIFMTLSLSVSLSQIGVCGSLVRVWSEPCHQVVKLLPSPPCLSVTQQHPSHM